MSSTSGVQNYLSNVFRPVYRYDTTTSMFTPSLEVSNIDNYSGNTISVFTAAVGDSNSNVYVGSNAGNRYDIYQNCFNITSLGYGAANNISNDCNSVYIGWYAGSGGVGSKDVISIGANSGGNGSSNVFIGTNTGTVGLSNIFIGHYIDPGNVNNQIKIGYRNQIPIAADLCTNWIGLGGYTNPVYPNDKLDVSGSTFILGNVGINTEPGVNGTLDVNGSFNVDDGYARLRFLTTGSNSDLAFSNHGSGTTTLRIGGTTTSTTGYTSSRGINTLTGGQANIGPIRVGIMLISAVDTVVTSNYAARMVLQHTTTTAVDMGSNVANGNTSIQVSGSGIFIADSTNATYKWSITYFPLP